MGKDSQHSVFLTRRLPDAVMADLTDRFRLTWNRKDRPLSKVELMRGLRTAEGLIGMLSDPIDAEAIGAAPRLSIIANYAVGYNNIDLECAAERNIVVTHTPGVLTETTADLTWGLILATARRFYEAGEEVRAGAWTGWAPTQFLGCDVHGKTLGIVGMGRIGQAVARRAAGFSMRVLYCSRRRLDADTARRIDARFVPLPRLLQAADFVSLHLPATPASHHLIDAQALSLMKPTAFLVNTSRGSIVDEAALIRALRRREIAGAGLDVFEAEPAISPALRRMKNVVLLPHIGSASTETRVQMGRKVIESLTARFAGKTTPHRVPDATVVERR